MPMIPNTFTQRGVLISDSRSGLTRMSSLCRGWSRGREAGQPCLCPLLSRVLIILFLIQISCILFLISLCAKSSQPFFMGFPHDNSNTRFSYPKHVSRRHVNYQRQATTALFFDIVIGGVMRDVTMDQPFAGLACGPDDVVAFTRGRH